MYSMKMTSWILSGCNRFIVLILGLNLWNVRYDHGSRFIKWVDINSSTKLYLKFADWTSVYLASKKREKKENNNGFNAELIFWTKCQIKPCNPHAILLIPTLSMDINSFFIGFGDSWVHLWSGGLLYDPDVHSCC